MDESSELGPRAALENAKESLEQKINEWQETIARLMKGRFEATTEFVNRAAEKLQQILPAESLEMPGDEFIEKYINAQSLVDDEVIEPAGVEQKQLGNQTIAALDQMDYLLNSSHHDAEIKEMAAKLQHCIMAKK
ncbi:hypothetical protein M3Y97_00508700 [Aphelenchoides bicaudatus]|nr:hypothetical protein M3Y97_00508700 [Aphelenchoides bicaudatus]